MPHQFPRRMIAGTGKATRRASLPMPAALCLGIIAIVFAPHTLAGNFTPPGMEGFSQLSERDADGDGDGVNETHILQYVNTQGDSMFSMTTRGRTWAWSLDTRDSSNGSGDYVIRDSDCDGVFDEVYGLDEDFHVPDCIK